ncbi:MAG TPA: hypothetical protein VKZ95_04395 [Sphingobacteriaceae bacterium]|nr:hypothetical protein [Sphingobacteriaceae bacterium]
MPKAKSEEYNMLKEYIESCEVGTEIEAIRYQVLDLINSVKSCSDQNIRALLFDLERCESLCVEFSAFWLVKRRAIEKQMAKDEIDYSNDEDKESNQEDTQ